jgi:hypothetical protein
VEFSEALERFGFHRADERGLSRGSELYTATPNAFMTYMVHAYDDGTALFTWEFAIVEFLRKHGLQVGSAEADNQFMYPRQDLRGPQDAAWLTSAIEQTGAALSSLRFDDPERF